MKGIHCSCGCGEQTSSKLYRFKPGHRGISERKALLGDAIAAGSSCFVPNHRPTRKGYVRIRVSGRMTMAHRWAYESVHGPVPEGFEVDHLCNNRACINPTHMQVLTHANNIRQITLRGRHNLANRTHCRRGGHPLSGDNLIVDKRTGGRSCKACARAASRRYAARLKAAAGLAAAAGAVLVFPSVAFLHHTTTVCQSPGVWALTNSEASWPETFTTSAGHSGTIPAGGTVTVAYSGTSLTVFGTWPKGPGPGDDVTNTSTGTGACTVPTTTGSPSSTSTVPTSVPSSTTLSPTSTAAPATTITDPSGPSTTPPAASLPAVSSTPPSTPNVPASSVSPVIASPASAGVLPATR